MLNRKEKSKAFTIVELLTVISIITLIIGLLVPALNKVNRLAKDMKQKAQFHSITTSLEMFKADNEEYPASTEGGTSPNIICGAQKLAEALVGRDLQGYDPNSNLNNPQDTTIEAYGYKGGPATYDQTKFENSLDRRKGPYLNTDNLPIFDIAQIYAVGTTPTGKVYPGKYNNIGVLTGGNPAPVITDIYKAATVNMPNGSKSGNAGTPILYYKANVANKFNDISSGGKLIYDIQDNDEIVLLGAVKDGTPHNIRANVTGELTYFYEKMIANPSVPINGTKSRPYRPDSYILISAGFDGIYGTNDDVTNYED